MKKFVLFRYNAVEEDYLVHSSFDTLQEAIEVIRKCKLTDSFKIASIDLSECLTCTFQDNKLFIV